MTNPSPQPTPTPEREAPVANYTTVDVKHFRSKGRSPAESDDMVRVTLDMTRREWSALRAFMVAPPPSPEGPSDAEIMLRGANAMIAEIEQYIPRNNADRDYAETVRKHVRSEQAFRTSAEARIEELEAATIAPRLVPATATEPYKPYQLPRAPEEKRWHYALGTLADAPASPQAADETGGAK